MVLASATVALFLLQFTRRALHHFLFNEVNHLFRLLLITILLVAIYL